MFHPRGPTFLELARQGLSSTESGYDQLAPKFDWTPFRTPDAVLTVVGRELAADGPVDAALDVCCGTGAGLRMLRPVTRGRLVGLDFSRGMLAEARRQLGDGERAPSLVRGDALALPYDAEFDLITCFGAFGHILPTDEPRFVRGVRRALRPGGRFVFVTAKMPRAWSRPWLFARLYNGVTRLRNALRKPEFVMYYLTFTQDHARALLAREGFEVEAREGLFGRPYDAGVMVVATRR